MNSEQQIPAKQREVKRDAAGRFLPGASPLGGRPPGTRHKLSSAFLQDLAVHWQEQGGEILQRVTAEDPATVLRVIASLVPRELALKLEVGADEGAGIVINLMGVAPAVAEQIERDITPQGSTDAHEP